MRNARPELVRASGVEVGDSLGAFAAEAIQRRAQVRDGGRLQVASAQRQAGQAAVRERVVDRNRLLHGVEQLVGHDRVGQRPARHRLREPRLEGVLLTVDPVEVAVGEAVPLPDVDQCVGPVEMVRCPAER